MAIIDYNTSTWIDEEGKKHKLPSKSFTRLMASKFPSHVKLRDFVFRRDKYTCQRCGAVAADQYPFRCYSPKWKKYTNLIIDHILSIRKDGSHHPDNLQALCGSCNSQKAGGK